MHKQISSAQNSIIKSLVVLGEKSKARKQSGSFIVEGRRELSLALQGGYQLVQVFYYKDLLPPNYDITQFAADTYIEVSKEVYEKIAYRATTEGVLAVVKDKSMQLSDLKFNTKTPLILVAEAPEKPGNIGAMLRTADAANVDAVLIANPKTDMFNPNIIRSSVGCLFTTQIATGTTQEILAYLKEHQVATYAAALKEDSEYYHHQNLTESTALIVGTEAVGLSDEWLEQSTKKIIIPMLGKIDSMNVSVAAGILMYEAKRQRNFK
ncbi:TrmH family RNA methyltransferase [Wenyingzhuangia marina]|uniref:RNA methyltransferase, TrmH family n=1 Tax=Wenyingzhuangia marina TaxID=1195760 RepID=A0A1M5VXL9_9FLAO|nr:RNA methyltransferase [Wenyingzhuangia marina]GGF77216.1 rRNA methyltransferase [Wenyingzhuangia marina]SHH79951.1 RNA methyltransferase, TrmH family [Wenyingzhuangia marina]